MKNGKIVSFTDLVAWKEAHALRMVILRNITAFPQDYRFGLSAQLQRSAISVGFNIAEGFGRQSQKEKLHFSNVACGSLTEVQDQLLICRDLKLINEKFFKEVANQSVLVHKLLRGLMRSINSGKLTTSSKLPAKRSEATNV